MMMRDESDEALRERAILICRHHAMMPLPATSRHATALRLPRFAARDAFALCYTLLIDDAAAIHAAATPCRLLLMFDAAAADATLFDASRYHLMPSACFLPLMLFCQRRF